MTEYRGAWDADGVADFLSETTVPVRIGTRRPDDSPWIVALWFRYRDGGLDCATRASADLVRFLRADDAVAFDVSTNDVPYRGVRGEGEVTVTPDEDKAVLRSLVERYLGDAESEFAQWLLDEDADEVHVRIDPRECYSWDYSERMGAGGATGD